MKKEIAEKWIAELRSGKWKQGQGSLCKNEKYCCLGLLSELAARESVCERTKSVTNIAYDTEFGVLPPSVVSWAGMKSHTGQIISDSPSLVILNDTGKTFLEIADIIEANIDNL